MKTMMNNHTLPTKRIPPDPDQITNEEGRKANGINWSLDPNLEDEWKEFEIIPCRGVSTATECLDTFTGCVECFQACAESFGQIGLLSQAEIVQAIVDTGASITLTLYESDFIEYTAVKDKVVKGLAAGLTIKGIGTVQYHVEVNGKTVQLKLKACHVPDSNVRLLCPQQLKKEVFPPGTRNPEIGSDCLSLFFPEGELKCPYNVSNLPVISMSPKANVETDLRALNGCVIAEKNQNLTAAQKELLKWHQRLGHYGMKGIQALLRTGALGDSPC